MFAPTRTPIDLGASIPAAPVNTSAPTISGSTVVGSTLMASRGGWTGHPTPVYTYEWLRDGVVIAGATSVTYTLVAADDDADISVRVTATNSQGSASAASATVGPVVTAPVNTTAPSIAGTAAVGRQLTITAGTYTGTATITKTYQWLADGVAIVGATGASYTLVAGDEGANIAVDETATNAGGAITVRSASVGPVTAVSAFSPNDIDGLLQFTLHEGSGY